MGGRPKKSSRTSGALQISTTGYRFRKPPRIETEATWPRTRRATRPIRRFGKIRQLAAKYPNGEKAVCCVGESGWAPAVFLRGGLENLLLDFALRPDFVKDLMKVGTEYYCELYKLATAAGADVVLLGDDYSDKTGPMMSPRQFDELVLPSDAAVVAAVKKTGAYCIKHTDGDIRKIMDQLVGTGIDCLGPLEPVPGMELEKILERYPGKIAVMGNINIDLLSRGSVEAVVGETKRVLATVSCIGPHIMSSANTIAAWVKRKISSWCEPRSSSTLSDRKRERGRNIIPLPAVKGPNGIR